MSSKDTLSSAPAAAQVTEPHQQQRLASSSSPPRPLATSPANPPLRSFARSISFEQGASQSQQAASTSSSKPLPPPLYLDGSSSSSSKSHDKRPPGSSSSSASSPTRARSRSLGAKSRDQQWRPLSEHAQLGEELDRGSGTPDYVLGRMAQNNGKGKGRLHDIVREGDAGGSPSIPAPAHKDTNAAAGQRPRLTTRLRSYFNSFSGLENMPHDGSNTPKARSSGEHNREDGLASPTYAAQTVSAVPRSLVVPSARSAASQPLNGLSLNDDSPPLTPTSDEGLYGDRMSLGGFPHRPIRQGSYMDASSSEGGTSIITPPLPSSTPATSRTDSPPAPQHKQQGAPMSIGTGGESMMHGQWLQGQTTRSSSPVAIAGTRSRANSNQRFTMSDVTSQIKAGLQSRTFRLQLPTLLMLLTFFVFTTLVVVLLLSTLPLQLPSHGLTQLSLAEMRGLCLSLRDYASSSSHAYRHTLAALCLLFVYQQAFNVPGSIASNIIFGALFGVWRATFYLSLFTAIGGSGAAIMSSLVAPLVLRLPGMAKAVSMMRKAIGSQHLGKMNHQLRDGGHHHHTHNHSHNHRRKPHHTPGQRSFSPYPRSSSIQTKINNSKAHKEGSGNLYSILLLLRVLPLTPYGVMNVACGILNVPLLPFASTLALGSVPWNAVTAQLGEILVEVVAALPGDVAPSTIGEQLDAGGFHDVTNPGVGGGSANAGAADALHGVLTSERLKLSSAAHKAGGGLKILMSKIWTTEMTLKLAGLSLLSLAPVILGKWWKSRQARKQQQKQGANEQASSSHFSNTDAAEVIRLKRRQQAELSSGADGSIVQPRAQYRYATPSVSVLPETQGVQQSGLPSWINQFSDDDDAVDGEYDYYDDVESASSGSATDADGEGDFEDEGEYTSSTTESPSSAASLMSDFAATAAEKSNGVGPALIASLTRSASRSSWRNAVNGNGWFGGLVGSSGSGSSSSSSPSRSHSQRRAKTSPFSAATPSGDDEHREYRPRANRGVDSTAAWTTTNNDTNKGDDMHLAYMPGPPSTLPSSSSRAPHHWHARTTSLTTPQLEMAQNPFDHQYGSRVPT